MANLEPIDAVIARSSLGQPAVRQLARRAPARTVTRIVATVTSRTGGVVQIKARDVSSVPPLTSPARAASTGGASSASTTSSERTNMASRRTSASAARAASKVLRDGRTGAASKTAAASALSQRSHGKKHK